MADGLVALSSREKQAEHYLLCQPQYSEFIAAAFLCGMKNLTFTAIDTDVAALDLFESNMFDRPRGKWNGVEADWGNWISSYNKGDATQIQRWLSDTNRDQFQKASKNVLVYQLGLPVTFAQSLAYTQAMYSSKALSANKAREAEMNHRIRLLCSGGISGKIPKTVLVIVGQVHVAPLFKLLGESHDPGLSSTQSPQHCS